MDFEVLLRGILLGNRRFRGGTSLVRGEMILVLYEHQKAVDNDRHEREPDDIGRGPSDESHQIHVAHLCDVDVVSAARIEKQPRHRAAAHGCGRRGGTNARTQQKRDEGRPRRRRGTRRRHDRDIKAALV